MDPVGERKECIAFRRNKRNGLTMSVTERYLRNDIVCRHASCTKCNNNTGVAQGGITLLQQSTSLIFPDVSAVSRYIEIFELDAFQNIVFCQTIIDALDQRNRTRTIRNVRRIVGDAKRTSVMFANEVFEPTIVPRRHTESGAERDVRAIGRAAAWYSKHLGSHHGIRFIILTAKDDTSILKDSGSLDDPVEVWSLSEYINTYHPELTEHFMSLRQATNEKHMDVSALNAEQYVRMRIAERSSQGYPGYWSSAELEDALRAGTVIRGVIQIRRRNGQEYGTVECADGTAITIGGRLALNRATPGDIVFVKILGSRPSDDGDDVECGSDPESESDSEDEHAASQIDAGEEPQLADVDQVMGTVVGIDERKWRAYVATLQEGTQQQLAVPVDSHVPKIRIHYMDARAIAGQYIVVAIDSWPAVSRYPHGHFVRAVGNVGDLDAEINTILIERQIAVSQAALAFPETCLREMPEDSALKPWVPSDSEIAQRRDMRSSLVFSIDPSGSQDIDDAVSMHRTSGGFELGVHIADVSQFVRSGSSTDREAMARGTTVYLADRRFNMIPEVLSEQVCSLRGGKDRYAVSVVWKLDSDYNVTDTWLGRTVIRSVCEMSYEQAQALLDGARKVDGLDAELGDRLRTPIEDLAQVTRVLRERRRVAGALELASTEVKFQLEGARIASVKPKKSLEIHRVIEETMVFANAAVAQFTHKHLPHAALLRRHPAPHSSRFARLVKVAESRGFTIDISSNRALAHSLGVITRDASNNAIEFLVKSMATLAMHEALYFPAGACPEPEFTHYGLALGFYTHFTSPIRRYADLVVHRQLILALARSAGSPVQPDPVLSPRWVADTANRLNELSRESKAAQRESTELFQSRYIQQFGGRALVADGVIAETRTNGLIVYVPQFGVRGPVHLRDTQGAIQLPASVLTGHVSDIDRHIPGCTDFSVDAQTLSIRLPIDAFTVHLERNVLEFSVFDNVKVALRVLETSRRRAPVYLTLLSRAKRRTPAYMSKLPLLEQKHRIAAGALAKEAREVQDTGECSGGVESTKPRRARKPKVAEYYTVLERFRELSVVESSIDSQVLGRDQV